MTTTEPLKPAAEAYAARFTPSAEQLRRWALKRLQRVEPPDPDESREVRDQRRQSWEARITGLIEALTAAGYLDDAAQARARAESLGRRGRSQRQIRQRLQAAGLEAPAAAADRSGPDPDRRAALIYARRRRLGPFGPEEARAARRLKDLAALARQGFAHDLCRHVIDAEDAGSLEDWADEPR